MPSLPNPSVVVFRPVSAATFLLPAVVGLVVAAGIVAGMVSGGAADTTAFVVAGSVVVVVVALLGLLVYTMTVRSRHDWDLTARTITFRGRVFPFAAVTRVVVCSGAKGWRGLLFATAEGRIRSMAVNINGYGKQAMGRDQWVAVRALLTCPHVPQLESHGMVTWGPGDVDRGIPQQVLRGADAVAVIDAQIGWIDSGRRSNSSRAPIDRFRRWR